MNNDPVNEIDPLGLAGGFVPGRPLPPAPQVLPGNSGIKGIIDNAGNWGDIGRDTWVFGFKKVCVKLSCNPSCPSDNGPWIVKDNSGCTCLEWKLVSYKW